jgi:hypothetical protein
MDPQFVVPGCANCYAEWGQPATANGDRAMIRFRKSLRAIPYFAILLMCGEAAHAAPIVLVEFTHEGFALRAGAAPATVPFGFGAGNPFFSWVDSYGLSDIGLVFSAPPGVAETADAVFHSPNPEFSSSMAGISIQSYDLSRIICGRCSIVVPREQWSSYKLTSVTRVLDRLTITPFIETYNVTGTHRIQLWGTQIPEPPTFVLLSLTIAASCMIRIRP